MMTPAFATAFLDTRMSSFGSYLPWLSLGLGKVESASLLASPVSSRAQAIHKLCDVASSLPGKLTDKAMREIAGSYRFSGELSIGQANSTVADQIN